MLADDGVVKVADFGMAKKMYYESNYERKEVLILSSSNGKQLQFITRLINRD